MSATGTDPSIWSVLLPVLVGGGLTLLGVALGPAITQWLESRSASQTTRIQRFEELLSLLQQHDDWLTMMRLVQAYGEKHDLPPEPLPKAFAISAIFFPEFLPDLRKIDSATRAYSLWMARAAQRRLEGKISEINDGFDAIYLSYAKTHQDARDRVIGHAVSQKGKV
ncbi:hypothetical protein [Mesorhizobium sp.]|uniref:hypothetical protein n=1 Tax=Mesorhizobium sp. TaxID=1871066 RepID=UPI00122017C5|nr:hypothetical protein [Mesorhizobium sp.]TIS51767.1 MAG: hypothetical protein E5W96_00245 [Mesorhizobium sp.]